MKDITQITPFNVSGLGGDIMVTAIGTATLSCARPKKEPIKLTISGVYYVKDTPINIISEGLLHEKGAYLDTPDCCVRLLESGRLIAYCNKVNYVYFLRIAGSLINAPAVTQAKVSAPLSVWHRRFGHVRMDTILKAAKACEGVEISVKDRDITCETCNIAKA